MATPKKAQHLPARDDSMEAAGYSRFSTEEQGSTLEQEGINQEIADEHGISIVARFSDEGVSRSLSERPGLTELFAFLEAQPNVRYLIVNELERLTAGIGQRQTISAMCKRLDVTIITEDMGAIKPHDEDKMHEADERSVRSQGEILKIRRRTKRSMRMKVRSGTSVMMRPCYGIRMKPLVMEDGTVLPSGASMVDNKGGKRKRISSGQIELHPDEYPHLVQIFDWSAAGLSLGQIAKRLNDAGVPTKSGRSKWSSPTVVGILNNRFYKGELTWGLQETRRHESGKKYTVVRGKGDPGRIDMESPLGEIIDAATWDRAKAQREVNAAGYRPRVRQQQPTQVLDGLVWCERCGRKMYGRNNANTDARRAGAVRWAYVCLSSRPQFKDTDVERCTTPHTMSLSTIFAALSAPSPTAKITITRGSNNKIEATRRTELRRIETAQADLSRAEDLAVDGLISKAKLIATKQATEATVRDAEINLRDLNQVTAVAPRSATVADGLGQFVELLRDEQIPISVRRAALADFGLEKVYVDKPFLRLHLSR